MEDFEFVEDKKDKETIVIKKSTYDRLLIAGISLIAIVAFLAGFYFSNLDSESVTKSDLESAILKLESKIENLQGTTTPSTAQARPQATPQTTLQPLIVSFDDDPIRGDPNAPITIVEFSDFQCPFCARFHSNTLPQIEQNYLSTGKVNFVYRDFPIDSIHPNARPAALASECADDQEEFWGYHDKLFENQREWQSLDPQTGIDTFKEYAQELGLNVDDFNSCLDSKKHSQEINNDLQDGREYGVTGTPAFFIGNEKIGFIKISGAQPYSIFQRVLDEKLEQ